MNQSDARFEPMKERFLTVSDDKIRELESRLKAPLPKAYVAFLSQYGGCGFSGKANVSFGDRKLPIFTFLDEEKRFSNLVIYEDLTAESKLAIADDMAGNPYVLDALTGSVYFIDFSVNPPVGTKVAESFDKFLGSIEVQPYE